MPNVTTPRLISVQPDPDHAAPDGSWSASRDGGETSATQNEPPEGGREARLQQLEAEALMYAQYLRQSHSKRRPPDKAPKPKLSDQDKVRHTSHAKRARAMEERVRAERKQTREEEKARRRQVSQGGGGGVAPHSGSLPPPPPRQQRRAQPQQPPRKKPPSRKQPVKDMVKNQVKYQKDFFGRKEVVEVERKIRANDPEYNASFRYANNIVKTSKYNVLTFLPKNLFEQFQRLANAYFLFLLILQLTPISPLSAYTTIIPLISVLAFTALKDMWDDYLIPWISSLSPLTTIIPLVAVVSFSSIKDGVDDFQRHKSDNHVNNRKSEVLRGGQLVEERWHKVVVGDIILMKNDQFVAADLLLLSTSEPNSLCYIETAELDGETNLKVRQALPDTAKLADNIETLRQFNGEITCEAPNNRLSKYEGLLTWEGESYSLDNDKLLLRGCILRNTRWCYGLVIFAGQDSKLMMNSGKTMLKRTHIDRLMNLLILGIFGFLASVCLICTICSGVWEGMIGTHFQVYLPWDYYVPGSTAKPEGSTVGGAITIGMLVYLSYIIVLNTVVPISLYVCVEVIRLCHSWWIDWDVQMYHEKSDTSAKSRTTTLNEELGQIEYIFSDKTGTLTQNVMTFNKCSIDGKPYGDAIDGYGNPVDITARTPKVPLQEENPMCDPKFEWYDQRLWDRIKDGDPHSEDFFRLLALCHTVMPEEKEGQLEYQAQSPDEAALVSAARSFGFVFRARTPDSITIEVHGETEVYDLLCILDFNNVRKRMSVIVRKEGKIFLYCKGADSTIYQRLDSGTVDMQELTTSHLNDFAQDGLRTLCLAKKEVDPQFYAVWKRRFHEASTSLENRDDKVSAVYEEIETDMVLLGATAIEDKLQDGVPDCIANLAIAGIKIWVLTGDKQETAINIGYSCRLLTDEMQEIYVIDGETYEEVEKQLRDARNEMVAMEKGGVEDPALDMVSYAQSTFAGPGGPEGGRPGTPAATHDFAIVLNGHSLVHALHPKMEMLLLETGCLCKAVICCRVTPLQKALVVDLVKKHKKTITLAIGDGANDVSMIKTAHIGVGISGQEGMQAVLASDFSLAQFRFLERLLLVHGRWSYLRMCKFLRYFFYKNFAFTMCHFWFAFFCGFSAQTVFDPFFITVYNVIYTSLPVMALGAFDQDVNEQYSLRYPKLYTPGHLDLLFNKKVFMQSVAEGIISSLVLFFIPYAAFHDALRPDGTDLAGHKAFGCTVASILIVAVTLRCAMDTSYWTGFNHFVIWGSILFYFGFTFVFYADIFEYSYIGTARNLMSTANFWFTMILTVTVLLLPVLAERFYYIDTRPTLTDKVRLKQKVSKSKAKSSELILRRASTMRRSTRSLQRSGYAFAHQEGFGELITKGTNMQGVYRRRAPTNDNLGPGRATRPKHTGSKSSLNAANGDANMDSAR